MLFDELTRVHDASKLYEALEGEVRDLCGRPHPHLGVKALLVARPSPPVLPAGLWLLVLHLFVLRAQRGKDMLVSDRSLEMVSTQQVDELGLQRLQALLKLVVYSCGSTGHFFYVTLSDEKQHGKCSKHKNEQVFIFLIDRFR